MPPYRHIMRSFPKRKSGNPGVGWKSPLAITSKIPVAGATLLTVIPAEAGIQSPSTPLASR
ncbi:MAG: hypothetical protein FJ012_04825 [Chloroflexi bacterium]|nr:hypothetical protein [Chloroflexota bacterium]